MQNKDSQQVDKILNPEEMTDKDPEKGEDQLKKVDTMNGVSKKKIEKFEYEKLESLNIEYFFKSQARNLLNVNIKLNQKKEEIKSLKLKKFVLGFMLFYITIYFFTSTALLIANSQSQENIEEHFVSGFHSLDFWGSFFFALVEALALIFASMMNIGDWRFFIALFNVGSTLVALVLFSFSPEYWEVPAHWCEYAAQVCLTLADFFFVLHNFKDKDNILFRYRVWEIIIVSLLTLASVLKLFIYGSVIVMSKNPEHDTHYFEFIGEMCNAIFAFAFTYLLYKESNQALEESANYKDLIKESNEEFENNIPMNKYF
jgi:hypothetical protein